MLPTIHNSELDKAGLPVTGFNKPLHNWFDIVAYMATMNEDQKVSYIQLLTSKSFQDGIAIGELNILEQLEEN
jgi:hypothetical protein